MVNTPNKQNPSISDTESIHANIYNKQILQLSIGMCNWYLSI